MNRTIEEEQFDACLGVLYQGLIAIRLAGWAGDATRCAQIADALHNLPDLLRTGHSRGWTVEQFVDLFLDPLASDQRWAADWKAELLRTGSSRQSSP
ncbi:MAG: hypothetical protein HY898_17835 [Deltaproteobacteria bacterium]|nr:hypothetical protein [Deltaproteobacteria bacterium]